MQKTLSDLDRVRNCLMDTEGYPSNVPAGARAMLVDAAPLVLSCGTSVAPHAHVDAIASFIRTALEESKAQAVGIATAAGARTAEAKAELQVVEQALGDAIDATHAATGTEKAAMKALRRAELAVRKSDADLKVVEASHGKLVSALLRDQAEGHQAREVLEGHFNALACTNADPEGTQAHLDEVTRLLRVFGAEESLLVSLPSIFGKPAAERTQWDVLAMDECKRMLQAHHDAIWMKIKAAAKAEREAEAQALGESAIQWVSTRRVAESLVVHEDAKVKVAAANEQVSKTFETVERHQTIVDYLLKESSCCDAKVEDIEESLEAFERLRNPAPCPTGDAPVQLANESEPAGVRTQTCAEEKPVSTKQMQETLAAVLLSKPTPCR